MNPFSVSFLRTQSVIIHESTMTHSQEAMWMLPERGGGQGDYRAGIRAKINDAIECLKTEPLSKRAVSTIALRLVCNCRALHVSCCQQIIPIPFNSQGSETVDWKRQEEAKCFRGTARGYASVCLLPYSQSSCFIVVLALHIFDVFAFTLHPASFFEHPTIRFRSLSIPPPAHPSALSSCKQ